MRDRLLLGVFLCLIFILPYLTPYDAMQTDVEGQNQPPSTTHIFGTDHLGRDVLSRLLTGGQITLVRTTAAAVIAVICGTSLALLRFSGRWGDEIARLTIDTLLAVPALITALVMITAIGQGQSAVALAVGISQIAPFSQVARAAVISVERMAYIESAYALGAGRWRITMWHILPNCIPTLAAYARVTFAYCLLNGAALGFLGFGGEPGSPEWGMMLAEARLALRTAPWAALAPGLAITLLILLVNINPRE